jgi:membrane protease YdiL (CAAX protease family)
VKPVIILSICALVLWMVMFSPWTSPYVNFWMMMALSAFFLAGSAFYFQRKDGDFLQGFKFQISDLFIGVFSAFILYMVFMAGDFVSRNILSFAEGQIGGIYGLKSQSAPIVIGLVLFFLIGPAEEIFWRGYIQGKLAQRMGPFKGYLAATAIYAVVHVWAFNFMLFGAALICALFWGFIYMKYRRLWPLIISHSLWDIFIFILLPLN